MSQRAALLIINPIEQEKWATELITEGNPITRPVSDSPRSQTDGSAYFAFFLRFAVSLCDYVLPDCDTFSQRVFFYILQQLTRAQSFSPSDQMASAGDREPRYIPRGVQVQQEMRSFKGVPCWFFVCRCFECRENCVCTPMQTFFQVIKSSERTATKGISNFLFKTLL